MACGLNYLSTSVLPSTGFCCPPLANQTPGLTALFCQESDGRSWGACHVAESASFQALWSLRNLTPNQRRHGIPWWIHGMTRVIFTYMKPLISMGFHGGKYTSTMGVFGLYLQNPKKCIFSWKPLKSAKYLHCLIWPKKSLRNHDWMMGAMRFADAFST